MCLVSAGTIVGKKILYVNSHRYALNKKDQLVQVQTVLAGLGRLEYSRKLPGSRIHCEVDHKESAIFKTFQVIVFFPIRISRFNAVLNPT